MADQVIEGALSVANQAEAFEGISRSSFSRRLSRRSRDRTWLRVAIRIHSYWVETGLREISSNFLHAQKPVVASTH
jgi:hypothetical protein